jgi:hypothetical protein
MENQLRSRLQHLYKLRCEKAQKEVEKEQVGGEDEGVGKMKTTEDYLRENELLNRKLLRDYDVCDSLFFITMFFFFFCYFLTVYQLLSVHRCFASEEHLPHLLKPHLQRVVAERVQGGCSMLQPRRRAEAAGAALPHGGVGYD